MVQRGVGEETVWQTMGNALIARHRIDTVMNDGCVFGQEAQVWDRTMQTMKAAAADSVVVRESTNAVACGAGGGGVVKFLQGQLKNQEIALVLVVCRNAQTLTEKIGGAMLNMQPPRSPATFLEFGVF